MGTFVFLLLFKGFNGILILNNNESERYRLRKIMSMKKWEFAPLDKERAAALTEECGIDPFLAILLSERGLETPEDVENFLYGNELTDDPFSFMDMDLAVDRIQRAIDNGDSIVIFGDYDADGITATVLLYTYLQSKNEKVSYLLPQRDGEGYGLHLDTIKKLAEDGVNLLITVDNGIAAIEEVELANSLGIDVVITDHHIPQDTLPQAVAVVDPHRKDCESAFKGYAGVGVAFKLVCALEGDPDWALNEYADLVALGTLADIMPLTGENRVLVRTGLQKINEGARLGLSALSEAAGGAGKQQTSSSAVFTLAPRINAAGRMGNPQAAAELLLSTDKETAKTLAETINTYNQERQQTEASILENVYEQIDKHPEWLNDRVLVVDGKDWFSGVIGILAARLLERYGKPCILLSELPEKVKGSGRSIKGFPLFEAISSCADILTSYGGHELAAGVSMKPGHVEEFRKRINAWAEEHYPTMPNPVLHIDCKLSPKQVQLDILKSIEVLEPFGSGNPSPVFALRNMFVKDIASVGNGKHLRISLERDNMNLNAMWFHQDIQECPFTIGDTIHVAVTLDRNEFRGITSVSIIVKDVLFSEEDRLLWLESNQQFDSICRGVIPTADGVDLLPTHDELATIYRTLRSHHGFCGNPEGLERLFNHQLSPLTLKIGMEILRQADLLVFKNLGNRLEIEVPTAEGKTDLSKTPLWKQLAQNA